MMVRWFFDDEATCAEILFLCEFKAEHGNKNEIKLKVSEGMRAKNKCILAVKKYELLSMT
jgi:hypothetical protein